MRSLKHWNPGALCACLMAIVYLMSGYPFAPVFAVESQSSLDSTNGQLKNTGVGMLGTQHGIPTIHSVTNTGDWLGDDSFTSVLKLNSGNASAKRLLHGTASEHVAASMTFYPKRDISVETRMGKVQIAAGSVAIVADDDIGQQIAIYDLYDGHSGDVKVIVNGHELILHPGRGIVLTNSTGMQFDKVNPCKKIAYRNAQARKISDGVAVFLFDVSIVSALSEVESLQKLMHSNNVQDRKLAATLHKTAAIQVQLTANAGLFHRDVQ